MVNCWASNLGDCSDKQSVEHYTTHGLWSAGENIISGFDWQKGHPKMLPVQALQSKILCEKHNNQLSELDAEATRIFRSIGGALEAFLKWQRQPLNKPNFPGHYDASGPLFERWCAKTVIDFVCVDKTDASWHDTRTTLMRPPKDVVQAIYGSKQFKYPMGLYLAQENTHKSQEVLREALNVDPRYHPEGKGLVGAFLEFRSYRFLVWLTHEPFESFNTETRSGALFGNSANAALYHPDVLAINFNITKHQVVLKW